MSAPSDAAEWTLNGVTSSLLWCPAFPAVGWRLFTDQVRRELDIHHVAELPELLRRTGVLEEDLVDVERIQLAGTVAVNDYTDTRYQLSQLDLVIRRHRLACCLSV